MSERERSIDGLGRVVMVIPTYNEADNLAWIVGRLRAAQPGVDVLVVDDDSPGRHRRRSPTTLAAADPQVTVLHRDREGRPRARRTSTASAVALDAGYDVIGEMDADGSHQPEQLPAPAGRPARTPTW